MLWYPSSLLGYHISFRGISPLGFFGNLGYPWPMDITDWKVRFRWYPMGYPSFWISQMRWYPSAGISQISLKKSIWDITSQNLWYPKGYHINFYYFCWDMDMTDIPGTFGAQLYNGWKNNGSLEINCGSDGRILSSFPKMYMILLLNPDMHKCL